MPVNPSKLRLYDRFDIDRRELKLIRVGHALWAMYRKARKSQPPSEIEPILAALEQVWELKRQLRSELKAEREKANAAVAARFAKRRG
jgi:hypothetical protein